MFHKVYQVDTISHGHNFSVRHVHNVLSDFPRTQNFIALSIWLIAVGWLLMQPALKPRDPRYLSYQALFRPRRDVMNVCYIESWTRWAGQWAVAFTNPLQSHDCIASRRRDQHSFTFWHFQPNLAASPIHDPIPIYASNLLPLHCISLLTIGIDLWAKGPV